jgi:hypothetical protein
MEQGVENAEEVQGRVDDPQAGGKLGSHKGWERSDGIQSGEKFGPLARSEIIADRWNPENQ